MQKKESDWNAKKKKMQEIKFLIFFSRSPTSASELAPMVFRCVFQQLLHVLRIDAESHACHRYSEHANLTDRILL